MNLEKILFRIKTAGMEAHPFTGAPAMLAVTFIYLLALLSVPMQQPQRLIWLAAYPIIASEITGPGYFTILKRSLWILPLVALIGIFNPIFDSAPAFKIGHTTISQGWVSFVSILLRGLLAVQALVVLVANTGFLNIFNSLRALGFPSVLTTQLLLTYRYITVVAEEALLMKRAREARGYGRKHYPISDWGRFTGWLLLRSTHRATRIHHAMEARGFNGTLPLGANMKWNRSAFIWLFSWTIIILILRFLDISSLFIP